MTPSETASADSRMRLQNMLQAWLPWVYTVALSLVLTLILSASLTSPTALDLQEGDIARNDCRHTKQSLI